MKDSFRSSLDPFVNAILHMKALNVVILDVRELANFADAFILASGRSHRQVSAIAESVELELKSQGIRPLGVEGLREGHWVLMDYGDVIVHVFYQPVRIFYDLEGLWVDARRTDLGDAEDQKDDYENE